jgi:MFS family permease
LISFNSAFLLGGALGAPAGGIVAGLLPGTAGYRLTFGICAAISAVVAIGVRTGLSALPPDVRSGRLTIGLPRFAGFPGIGPALVLGTLGDFLRGGLVYTALPLAGQVRHLTTVTIGTAVGLLLCVEILTLRLAGPLLERFGIVRCLVAALSGGVVTSTALAVAQGRPAFVAGAVLFGVVIGAATIGPPLLLVALNEHDAAAGLASYRVSSGFGMLIGSTGAGAAVAALGPSPAFFGLGAILLAGVVLARHVGKRLPRPSAA